MRGSYSSFNTFSACCTDVRPVSRDFMVCKCVFWVLYNSATCVFSVVMSSLWLKNKGNGVNGVNSGDLEDGEAGIVS